MLKKKETKRKKRLSGKLNGLVDSSLLIIWSKHSANLINDLEIVLANTLVLIAKIVSI